MPGARLSSSGIWRLRRVHLEDGAGLDVRLWAPANKSLKQTAAAALSTGSTVG